MKFEDYLANSGIAHFSKKSENFLLGLPRVPKHKSVGKVDLRLSVFAQLTLKVRANQPRPRAVSQRPGDEVDLHSL